MKKKFNLIVMGASFGGVDAISFILSKLSSPLIPIVIVQHVASDEYNLLYKHFDSISQLTVQEANSGSILEPNYVYLAPANYHLLIEEDHTLSLSLDERVNFSRPSIDILFESAAFVYTNTLIGVLLTGANNDGSEGLAAIKAAGGLTIVQDPKTALAVTMPKAALDKHCVDYSLDLPGIVTLLQKLCQ